MDEKTQKTIEEQMKNLPKDVLEAIISVDYKTQLQEITKRQRLLIDQAGKLEMETTLVMIGLEPLADFLGNIQKELNVPNLRARDITMDVSEHIFKPIRESLKKMNETLEDSEDNPNGQEGAETEPAATKFTNSNETGLNRDQILKEIEDPSIISGGDRSMNFNSSAAQTPAPASPIRTTTVEVRPAQEIETIPGQTVKDITKSLPDNILEAKMTGSTVIPQQIVNAKPEIKLPEVTRRPSYGGADPYREEIK